MNRLHEKENLSYGLSARENKLIHGDNLLVLDLLQDEFKGKIQCICIDPPYNSGHSLEHYDDAPGHSAWLEFMRKRLLLLKELLAPTGFIVCFIDDVESHYLKVLMDEIFGRDKFLVNMHIRAQYSDETQREKKRPFVYHVMEEALVYRKQRTNLPYLKNNQPIKDFYDAEDLGDRQGEGGLDFRGGKKPERLIQIVLQHFSKQGDWVLDCFLGSGTTAAVAHKMDRRWIGVEMGQHIYTHCLPRLRQVVDGTDATGIATTRGNSDGFRFFEVSSIVN